MQLEKATLENGIVKYESLKVVRIVDNYIDDRMQAVFTEALNDTLCEVPEEEIELKRVESQQDQTKVQTTSLIGKSSRANTFKMTPFQENLI